MFMGMQVDSKLGVGHLRGGWWSTSRVVGVVDVDEDLLLLVAGVAFQVGPRKKSWKLLKTGGFRSF